MSRPGQQRSGLRRRRRLLVLVLALLATMVLVSGLYLGQRAAYTGLGIDPVAYRQLQKEIPEARAQVEELRRELEVSRARHQVDRDALELVRREIAQQKEEMASLEEGLRFYRSLMSPNSIAQGLSLRPIELVQRGDRRYAYRIVAQQEARKHPILRGELTAEISGRQGEDNATYTLSSLADDLDNDAIKLRFRYFQSIEGELELPQGFVADSVIVVARSTSPGLAEIREQYPWRTNERFTLLGK